MPAEYNRLGLTQSDLRRHITWDPGAAAVTRQLSDYLGAPAFLSAYSRLLIDLNRPLDAPSSIVTRSEATDIPGNLAVDPAERLRRQDRIFAPYHSRVSDYLDLRQQSGSPVWLVSIHSFTPVFKGVPRPWHAGVLFDKAAHLGEALVARLRRPGVTVGANVPYQTDRAEDYSVPIHGDDRGIPAVLIEIRNDLIADDAGVNDWARHLAVALHAVTTV